jgi:diguanylate cyclase (GGDEF)-like protein/PAS domain S-box-containing protein
MSKPSPTEKNQQRILPSELRLLIVEDVLEDAELIALSLEMAGVTFTYDRADTAALCQNLLQEKTYDAVLADYRLPSFNGLGAFELLQQSRQEIPFILVTGSLGEEAAVGCIKAGMTDYVLKERLFRLPSALERSLQEFELRRQQKAAIAQIKASAKQEAIINQIVQAMRSSLVLDEVLQITVEQLHEVLQVSRCLIVQPDSNQKMKVDYVSEARQAGKSLIGVYGDFYQYYQQTLAGGGQVVVNKVEDRLAPEMQKLAQEYGIQSMMITPLFYGQSYLGGISLYQCDREREWTENELTLVKTIADHCAIAIHQAKLYQQAQIELAERRRAELELRRSERRFRALIENATDIILILDADRVCRYVSPSAQRIIGYAPEELFNRSLVEFVHSEDRLPLSQALDLALARPGISQPAFEYRLCSRDGSWYVLEAVVTNLLHDPSVEGIALNCHEITQRKKAEEQLRHDALHDTLTGLPNRSLFLEFLERAIRQSQSRKDWQFAVLFLDLDRFKTINDSLGHLVGDQLLIALAHRLEKCRRAGDTVARLGGDEFVILLEALPGSEEALKVAERIHQALTPAFILNNQEVFISASIGIALSTSHYERPEQLLRDADTAMYYAKARGKSCHEVFAPSMHARAMRQLQLESDLRRAIERQEFLVYYQPIVSLESNCLQGVEALVRWQHPEQGLISPAEFIPLAEETGLITLIDRWVLREACRQLRVWQEQFRAIPPWSVSVNLSGKQFSQPNLIEEIDRILAETGLEGQYLKLEVTESVLIENAESAAAMLGKLREREIQVCIDDFGTGYSSLSYLHRFPINILKIDRSFISCLDRMGENSAIVRTIATLAQDLQVGLIAEGVETAGQMAFLKTLGCQCGQGYWLSPPLESKAMETFMHNLTLDCDEISLI